MSRACVCVCVPALTLLCLEWWSEDYDQAAISLLPRIWQWCELASIRFRFKRQQHTGGFQGSVFDLHNYFHKIWFCAKFTPFNYAISCLATRQGFSKRIVRPLSARTSESWRYSQSAVHVLLGQQEVHTHKPVSFAFTPDPRLFGWESKCSQPSGAVEVNRHMTSPLCCRLVLFICSAQWSTRWAQQTNVGGRRSNIWEPVRLINQGSHLLLQSRRFR